MGTAKCNIRAKAELGDAVKPDLGCRLMTGHDSIGWRRHSRASMAPSERSMGETYMNIQIPPPPRGTLENLVCHGRWLKQPKERGVETCTEMYNKRQIPMTISTWWPASFGSADRGLSRADAIFSAEDEIAGIWPTFFFSFPYLGGGMHGVSFRCTPGRRQVIRTGVAGRRLIEA